MASRASMPSVTFANPGPTSPTAEERQLRLRYLRAQRGDVVRAALGVSEHQLRWGPEDRLLPIIGINHLTHVEWRWIDGRYLGYAADAQDWAESARKNAEHELTGRP